MKFSLMYLTLVSLFYTMNLCEIKIEKTNSLFELGNCTDIGQIINLQSMEEVSGSLSNNLKKYFYDKYQAGTVNVTNVYSVNGSQNIRQKIEYFKGFSAIRMLSNPDKIMLNSIGRQVIDEKKEDIVFIAFGRITDSSTPTFEYDVVLKLNKNAIQNLNSDNTEFEILSSDFELSYRSALQNCVKDLIIENGKLEFKIKESIYPTISFSMTINPVKKDDYYTIIEVNMLQGTANINSFIYYPLLIFYALALIYFFVGVADSSDRMRYSYLQLSKSLSFYIHCYFVVSILKLVSGYLLEYYSVFKLVKLVSILANFGNVFITIIIAYQVIYYNFPYAPNYFITIVLFIIFHILIFYFLIFDLFCKYVVSNLWVYAVFTNVWMYKFCINFICKIKIAQFWFICIPVSIIICFFQLDYFSVHAYDNHFNIYYVLFLLFIHCVFISLVNIQQDKGSRFFLPNKMRTQIYQKLLQSVEPSGQDDALLCQVCMNPIDQPELEYSDNNPAYKWMRFPIGTFIKTDCSHIFHPNCILKSITLNSVCPVCMYTLNIGGFDD